jgi:hypothetical protein
MCSAPQRWPGLCVSGLLPWRQRDMGMGRIDRAGGGEGRGDIDGEKTRLTAWTLHPREMSWSFKPMYKPQNRETEKAFSMTVTNLHPVEPTLLHADTYAYSGTGSAHTSKTCRANYAMVHCGLLVYVKFNPPQLRTRRAMNVICNTGAFA